MFLYRQIRGISRYLPKFPKVDKLIIRGGNSQNVYLLKPVPSSVPFLSSLKENHCLIQSSFQRLFSTSNKSLSKDFSEAELKRAVDNLTDQFMDTRELLEDARESVDTVYHSEDMTEATESLTKTLEDYENLLNKLSVEQKQDVVRSIGLKIEELKAQKKELEDH